MKIIPNSLFEVRKAAGLTRSEMGAALGVAENYIYLIESGRKPYSPKLQAKVAAWKASLPAPEPLRASAHPRKNELSSRDPPGRDYGFTAKAQRRGVECRLPADCDLSSRLASMETALAQLSGQVNTLTQLLGATLAKSTESVAGDRKKAG